MAKPQHNHHVEHKHNGFVIILYFLYVGLRVGVVHIFNTVFGSWLEG